MNNYTEDMPTSAIIVGLIAFSRVDGSNVSVDVYDPWTGNFRYNAVIKKELWDAALPNGLQQPALVYMAGMLKDDPIMHDVVSMVDGNNTLLEVYHFKMLPCTPHLPEGFEYLYRNAHVPITFATGITGESLYQVHLGGDDLVDFMTTSLNDQEEWDQGTSQVQQQQEWIYDALGNGVPK